MIFMLLEYLLVNCLENIAGELLLSTLLVSFIKEFISIWIFNYSS